MKPARLRPAAEEDLVATARHHAEVGGRALGERLFDAALSALEVVQRMPAMGSPRLGVSCEMPGLRSWHLTGFPMQWLYVERADHLDVIRLLADRQDIETILTSQG